MGQFSKKWEDLQFYDNFIFCKVMKNKNLCRQMLEILLGINVQDIEYIQSEHPLDDYYQTRGIRMDVYVEGDDKVFNLEMQTGDYEDLLLRSRYYLSASDISSTPRRTKFKDLKETYIIFICKDDPFGEAIPLYTEIKSFKELPAYIIKDKTHKLFYNTSAYAKAETEEIRDVLEFIYKLKANSKFTKQLENSVTLAKADHMFKDEYMYFADILEDEKEEARAIGLAEGRATGLAEGRATGLAEGRAEGLATGRNEKALEDAVMAVTKYNIESETAATDFNVALEDLKKALGK